MTLISFLCRRGLNPKSLIQVLETLLVELTRTHISNINYWCVDFFFLYTFFLMNLLIYFNIFITIYLSIYNIYIYNTINKRIP